MGGAMAGTHQVGHRSPQMLMFPHILSSPTDLPAPLGNRSQSSESAMATLS
ncbi:hypothetical protein PGTUg99_033229 [Puccinia graminis f. sp. tritici]|uniref:Uncharacterized protein n=1 Tax=Puccinia graminis f. sp. tritici TaxID=56615 RepID=A0A5B0MEC6_PUCGR|nr:hypothetical protein PGTUg99_033229 [Puccinia graminis f. sp. tritici]